MFLFRRRLLSGFLVLHVTEQGRGMREPESRLTLRRSTDQKSPPESKNVFHGTGTGTGELEFGAFESEQAAVMQRSGSSQMSMTALQFVVQYILHRVSVTP